ncbi:hypothetical protein [Demequina mangrovi]|uniref:Uncharacterized protein n=1 Tax=Demequina mangrovi TaxID=1043493 RepID=A0A1H6UGH4_9MICO|nr:hypothetical protein [Demequina mangrovi]SEI91429.1 hypothetical protein SAMN05421637_0396 [Demequina mangrovi]
MSGLRTAASAALILLGAMLIVAWAVAGVVVSTVEDGTAVHGIAVRALESDAVLDGIADAASDSALEAMAEAGFDAERWGLDTAVRAVIADAARADEFRGAVLDQIDAVHAQASDEITAEDRPSGPLRLEIDVSGYVNAQIDAIPVVGEQVPDLVVEPIPVRVLGAEAFERVRTGYGYAELAQRWALWAGLACIVLGFVVTHRTRWFGAKAGLAVGAIAGGLWLVLTWWGLDGILRLLPGGSDGDAAEALLRIVTEDGIDALASRLGTLALIAFAVAAVLLAVALLTRPRPRPLAAER